MEIHARFPQGLTFDDVLLQPGYTDFSRQDIDLSVKLSQSVTLAIPLLSSPMDTVTESTLAIALGKIGGLGVIHRNLSKEQQADEVNIVKKANLVSAAAVGVSSGFKERVKMLTNAGVDVLVVDSAHGFSKHVISAVSFIKQTYPTLTVIGGSIATRQAAKALISAGADALRVGMGPGAICTTRIISGMGVPQVSAILETAKIAREKNVPIIADGGIKYSGDIVKALAAGSSFVMMGSFFASAKEAPGDVVTLTHDQVPHRFQSIFQKGKTTYLFKQYRGMGSIGAMQKGAKMKSEDEFHGKSYEDRVLVAEGVEGLVPIKGSVKTLVDQAIGGIKSGMYYVGAKSISQLWEKASFVQITQASLVESHPHDVLITNPGENY